MLILGKREITGGRNRVYLEDSGEERQASLKELVHDNKAKGKANTKVSIDYLPNKPWAYKKNMPY